MISKSRRSRSCFAIVAGACLVLWLGAFGVASEQPTSSARPNIVLMFPDNLGWGEVNVYGGVRGAITPRLDRLAAEGLRLNNFNVEFSCTVSRAALMTGRYAVRTGATQAAGMTLWEVTIAEALAVERLRHGTLRQVASWRRPAGEPQPVAAGVRRVLRRAAHQQRGADDDRAGTEGAEYLVHLGRPKRFAAAQRQTLRPRGAPHRRSRIGRQERRLHGAQRPRQEAVLRLLPDDADSLPDADPSRLRRQDRRGRYCRRDGRTGLQRRPHARCDRSARRRAQHHRVLVHRQRRRGAAAVARIVGPVVRFLQQRDGGRHPHALPGPLARENSGRPRHQRAGARNRFLPDHRGGRRRRHRAARSRHRRRQPAALLRRETSRPPAASRCCSTPTPSCAP